jgi:hypothetical protein
MLIVPFHHRTNVVARQQVRTKVIRALTRRPKLKDKVFTPQVPVVLDGQPTGAVLLDTERFLRISDLIVRGIHYHHAGKAKLRGEVKVPTTAFALRLPLSLISAAHAAQIQTYSSTRRR